MPHLDTAQAKEHETKADQTRYEGGGNCQGGLGNGNDDGKGDGPNHNKLEGNGPEGNVFKGDETKHENREGNEHEVGEHERGDGGQEDAQHKVVNTIVEKEHENDGQDVETGHDGDMERVDATQPVPKVDQNKNNRRSMLNHISPNRNKSRCS